LTTIATTADQGAVVFIESFPSIAHAYLAEDTGSESSSRLTIINGDSAGITYEHVYSFPDNAKGFAGLIFEFDNPQDLSAYASVELTIALAGSPKYCSFAIGDAIGNFKEVPCQGPFAADSGITAKVDAAGKLLRFRCKRTLAALPWN